MAFNAPFVPSTHEMMPSMYHHSMHHSPMHHSPMHFSPMHHGQMHHVPMHNVPMHPMHPMHEMSSMFNNMMRHPMSHMMNPMHEMSMVNNMMRHSLPREIRDVAFRPMSMVEYNTFMHPVMEHADGSRSLHLAFDVRGFKPEEVKVDIMAKERSINVEAKHEVKDKEHQVTRHFSRKFVIPEDLHIDLTKCEPKACLTPEGLLVVESCLPRLSAEELKAYREKSMTKHHMMGTPSVHPFHPSAHFNPTVAVPIKMN